MAEKTLEEKIEDLYAVFEKKRRKIINEPDSEEKFVRLELIDYVIGCTSGIVNRNRKIKKQQERQAEEKAKAERKAKFEKELAEMQKPYQQAFNYQCRYYCEIAGERYCDIDMDMIFCGKNCAYATNVSGSTKVKNRGVVIVNNRKIPERRHDE